MLKPAAAVSQERKRRKGLTKTKEMNDENIRERKREEDNFK
jgi:hypothetical protein